MNDSLNSLLNLINSEVLSEKEAQFQTKPCKKTSKKLLTKPKVDKNIINLVYDEVLSSNFMILCGGCKRETTWKEAARVGWIFHGKKMSYICPNCV
jgi:hypothetical protein